MASITEAQRMEAHVARQRAISAHQRAAQFAAEAASRKARVAAAQAAWSAGPMPAAMRADMREVR